MTPERWQQIKAVFNSALERPRGERSSFLEEACAGDESLRHDVESLINSHEQEDPFIDAPAYEVAAELLVNQESTIGPGHDLGSYRVLSTLGRGGMGEVYLAEDVRLGRKVALKLLPSSFTHDSERLRRFEREARAASALNHPNILTIYEVGSFVGRPFIASEYVEGQTLRQRQAHSRLKLTEVLDIAIQIAAALATAHRAGIVHRDIKPENIILRSDGYAKVVDFGLAKLTESSRASAESALSTILQLDTGTGVVMGTTAYMSPEQARGLPVDKRTDIWSLGVVLYEMVARQAPFDGATPTDVIISIAQREPVPLASRAPEVPIQLEQIVKKSLAKDREERYQTAEDLLIDLKSLRHELEIDAEVERSKQPITRSGPAVTTSGDQVITSRFFPLGLTRSRILILTALVGMLMIAGLVSALFFRQSSMPATPSEIKSLAVLPLKSLNREAGDDYLGLGIADTIITKVSQAGGLTVRPTSAVRKYADQEIDALEAAKQLQADSVLDGTFLHAGDRLRVSVNLLRVRDGASLWADSFDVRFTDIFAIQDEVSKEVAARLRLKLGPTEQARLTKRYHSNPQAYDYYTKAAYHFSNRDWVDEKRAESDQAIELLRQAIGLDQSYALAHAQLGYAYAWTAIVYEEDNPALIEQAKQEIDAAERLDPQLAEVHVARAYIFWSQYEGWQVETAIRELRLAQQLDPQVGHFELADIYAHIGLDEQHEKAIELALKIDPTSSSIKRTQVNMFYLRAMPDEALAAEQRFFNRGPDARYFLEKRMLKEVTPLVMQEYQKAFGDVWAGDARALLLALQGKHREAEAALPALLERAHRVQRRGYHHVGYTVARIYALGGKGEEAVKWLKELSRDGFPNYPLFLRDSFLDPIRKDPAFIQFMAEMKTRWEGYRREFG